MRSKSIIALALAAGLTKIGDALNQVSAGADASTNDSRPPRVNRRRGYSAAQGKRMARKRRNQLRAKGHYRQAVR